MSTKGYVYVSEDEKEAKEPDAKRARSGGGLRRLDSVFLRSEAPVPVVRAPDWQRAWTNFLSVTRDQTTFWHNPGLKGMWSGLLFFVEQFECQVKRVVKILVAEMDRPDETKSIRQISAGGLAGGQKYLHDNVFYKFAFDHIGMYGGDDQLAAKAAGRELANIGVIADLVCSRRKLDERGKIRCLPPVVAGLCVPFAVCVDYLGYRIFASTLLPIGAGTLVYGSQDGGKTTLNSDPAAVQLASTVAQHLNLKLHNVGRKSGHKEMHLAADVELHRGRDGRMWIVDLARLMPPFPPASRERRELVLCEFVRPCVVRANAVPVSPDAFTGFNRTLSAKADNAEVQEMANRFFDRFPEIAATWDAGGHEWSFARIRSNFGVNARFLGRLLQLVKSEDVRFAIAFEIVHRTLKSLGRRCHTPEELFELLAAKTSGADFAVEIQTKFGIEDIGACAAVIVDATRVRVDLGIVGDTVEPIVTRISCLTEIVERPEESEGPPLQRGEVIGSRLGASRHDEFDRGFFAVLEGCGFDEEKARECLATQRKIHFLV